MTRARRHRLAVATVLVALAACGSDGDGSVDGSDASPPSNATVVRVVDGDTLVADLSGREERVRLIGIDAPESVIPDTPPECFGPEAGARLAELLPPGTPVLIERDAEARDRFDRLLGYVHRSDDGLFVNLAMVEEGFADTLRIAPNTTHAAAFSAAAEAARDEARGLWGAC